MVPVGRHLHEAVSANEPTTASAAPAGEEDEQGRPWSKGAWKQ